MIKNIINRIKCLLGLHNKQFWLSEYAPSLVYISCKNKGCTYIEYKEAKKV